jgi:hypothetical protein
MRAPALADNGSHGAAHEGEFERAGDDRLAEQGAARRDQGVFLAGLFLRLRQPVAVLLAVSESQRILRLQVGRDLLLRIGIEEPVEPRSSTDAHVMLALGADVEVALKLRPVELRIAFRAFDPDALRDGARALLRLDARGHQFLEPAHGDGS